MSKKRLSVLILVIIFSLFISGCFGKKKETSSTDTNIRVYAFGNRSEEIYLENTLNDYMDNHPEIQTNLRVAPLPPPTQLTGDFVSGYENLLLGEFAAQDPPDVFYLNKGRVPAYIENKALLNLRPYLPKEYIKSLQLDPDEPIYALPYFQEIQLVAAFSCENPQETVDLLFDLSNHRIALETKLATEAANKAALALEDGAGILDDPESLYDIWNNLALSYQNKEISIDDDAKQDDVYLISHEQAQRYPYMMLKLAESPEHGENFVSLTLNQQHIDNPTLRRNMATALKVLVRSIHSDINERQAEDILTQLGVGSNGADLEKLKDNKLVKFGNYEFTSTGDLVSLTLSVTKLP